MAKGWSSKAQKGVDTQIAELEIKKRNGLLRAIASIAGFILIAALYTAGIGASAELEGSLIVRALIYISALVLAGTCGYGTRAWYRADNEIKAIRQAQNSKKKRKK